MRIRTMVTLVAVIAAAGCTREATGPSPSATASRDVLVLDTGSTLVVGSGTGSLLAPDAGTLAAPDGSRIYAALSDGSWTAIETRDGTTGEVLATTSIPGRMALRAASVSGAALAFVDAPPNSDPWVPIPRATTTLVVADPTGAGGPQRFRVRGNVEPEAFSIDDTHLFLIEYLPPQAPTVYRVTSLDLATGEVDPVKGRFKTPPERMPGVRLSQVYDPATEQLYTLYANQPTGSSPSYGYGDQDAGADEAVTFIHVLNMREGWAYCAGVPRAFWGQPASAQAMAASPDGRLLYVIDSERGEVMAMDTRTLRTVGSAQIALGGEGDGRTTAQVSADGSTLFVGSASGGAVYAVDTSTFEVRDRWATSGSVSSLRLSPDGARLWAALPDRLEVIDPANGSQITSLSLPGVRQILAVSTPTT